MENLRGPNIQIVLHVKEGLGFNFLSSPVFVSGSLNGYTLETDPMPPCHTPKFDADLVWETDKRKFRNLRIQNVPVKVGVYSENSLGKKIKVGYLLLSLLGAQPYSSNGPQNSKHTWHKLLGVKGEGKCCYPQLLLSLTVEDWNNAPTTRNTLPVCNQPENYLPVMFIEPLRTIAFSLEDYATEMNRKVTSSDLNPQLLTDEGLILIGRSENRLIFELSFAIHVVENVDVMVPESLPYENCTIVYSVFSHNIETDSFPMIKDGIMKTSVQFKQKTSLKLCTDLSSLSKYFAECPYVVMRFNTADKCVGVCSTNLCKLIPTEDINTFVSSFCNTDQAITIHERCFLLPCLDGVSIDGNRKPYIDFEISLAYVGKHDANTQQEKLEKLPSKLDLETKNDIIFGVEGRGGGLPQAQMKQQANPEKLPSKLDLEKKNNITIGVEGPDGGLSQAQIEKPSNPTLDIPIFNQEVVDMIRKMYESLTVSRERILSVKPPPVTADVDVQYETPSDENGETEVVDEKSKVGNENTKVKEKRAKSTALTKAKHRTVIVENDSDDLDRQKSDHAISRNPDFCTPHDIDRKRLINKFSEELEDWKMEQQQIFKRELKRKEQRHLEMLAEEWNKCQSELESRLNKGIEQCRNMAAELSRAAEDFRQRCYDVAQREEKLLKAKKTIEQHYANKLQSLREASVKMADDTRHRLKLRDMRVEELEAEIERLTRENCLLKKNAKLNEIEREGGLTKEQASGLVQELRNLENQLNEAEKSKAFFKEQYSKAVRDAQAMGLMHRRQTMARFQQPNQLDEIRLDEILENPKYLKSNELYHKLVSEEPILRDACSDLIEGIDSHRESARSTKRQTTGELQKTMAEQDRQMQMNSPDEGKHIRLNSKINSKLLAR